MAEMKQALFDYLAQRHFDLMPAAVMARFEDYMDKGSFTGNMKKWSTDHYGKPLKMLDNTTIPDADDWKRLYMSCQKAFQAMDKAKSYDTGYGSPYNPDTNAFIGRWFSNDGTKLFTKSKATNDTETILHDLGIFLENNASKLKSILTTNYLKDSVFNDISYENFCKSLKDKKFNDNIEFRSKVQAIVEYIRGHIVQDSTESPEGWPPNLGYNRIPPVPPATEPTVDVTDPTLKSVVGIGATNLDLDPENWYEIGDIDTRIAQFKDGGDYKTLFDELLTNSTFRQKFLEKVPADSAIKQALEDAIARTDYENKESDNYVPPKPTDKKNLIQTIKKWKNDTYENHFRRFFDHNRGARVFYSPIPQNIMKAFDKAGLKPTDGLQGILDKKEDAKLKEVINEDPQTKKHFDWFTKQLETIKSEMPDAFEGALRNGHQLRAVVMRIIATTKPADKEKAKTALEVLSVAKYGLSCSRTLDVLREATKDMSILSDKDLSWNKNEGIRFVTKAMDKAAGLAIRGVGRIATGVHNFIQHRRTKINNDISKYKDLDSAYKKWRKNDADALHQQRDSNTQYDVAGKLAELNNPARAIAAPYETNVQINDALMGTEDTPGPLRAAITAAETASLPNVIDPSTGAAVPLDKLKKDVTLYEEVTRRQKLETPKGWRESNPDVMGELIEYWNKMETYRVTHTFELGSMKVKRENMLRGWNNKTSEAQNLVNNWMAARGPIRTSP